MKNQIKCACLLVMIALSIVGCGPSAVQTNKEPAGTVRVSLRQEWFPYSGYSGEVFAVNETAKKYGMEIDLQAGSDQIDPIKLVLSGENTFGVASADKILQANEKGADLVVIGVVNAVSPTCYLTKESSGITSPSQFVGKRVGILTGTNTELIYQILKLKTGLKDKSIREMEVPFDLATFISGQYDVRPAFIYDEPVSLDLQGIRYNVIKPSDYGIRFIGTVYFTTRKYAQENPSIVEKFVASIADGWKAAIENPEKAIDYLKSYDSTIDANRELLSFKKGIEYFRGDNGRVLYASEQNWNEMAAELKEIDAIKEFDFSKTVMDTYVNKYHSK